MLHARTLILILVVSLSSLLAACAVTPAFGPQPTATIPLPPQMATSTRAPASTVTPTATPSPILAPSATSAPRPSAIPVATPAPTQTATAVPTATTTLIPPTPAPEPAQVVLLTNANLRSGPGTVYPVIGGAQAGQALPVLGQALGWWQTPAGWVFGELVRASQAAQAAPTVRELPATPTGGPRDQDAHRAGTGPASAPQPPASSPLPPRQDVVALGPVTQYPVRARVVKGWGYELVDASAQYDWLIQRDVFGQVAHAYWGDAGLYKQHPQGIRITLIDRVTDPKCDVSGFCPLQAPIPLSSRGQHDYDLTFGYSDGGSASVWASCANWSKQYDPQECFIAVKSNGEHLTDIVVTGTIIAQNLQHTTIQKATPDFTQAPFTLLGQAHKEGDQWRWANPFLVVVPAQ